MHFKIKYIQIREYKVGKALYMVTSDATWFTLVPPVIPQGLPKMTSFILVQINW